MQRSISSLLRRKTAAFLLIPVALGTQAAEARKRDQTPDLSAWSTQALADAGTRSLLAARPDEGIGALVELAARNPKDADDQTLLALAYHAGADRNPEAAELALAGYDIALRNQPSSFWAAALAGRIDFDRGRFAEAETRYAQAVLARPADARALLGLGSAAYLAGDPGVAAASAQRALALGLDGAERAAAMRVAAFAAMALGDSPGAARFVQDLETADPAMAAGVRARLAELQQTNAVDAMQPAEAPAEGEPVPPAPGGQVSVDVAIILSQNTHREHIGLNLLDGLTLNYARSRQNSQTRTREGETVTRSAQRVITEAISLPQLSYNLNLFNRRGQAYSVVARPSLTAWLSETSEFFIGRTLKVAVGGVNTAALEQIDIGIEMKLTPVEISATGARMRVEVSRSFLSNEPTGTFSEALSTFRQKVAATAEVRFGETLILSGLSEQVEDRTSSRTPVLGDIPVIQTLFNERNSTARRDAALVLVTPFRPVTIGARSYARSEAVARLVSLWGQVIDPSSNLDEITRRLGHVRLFTRMKQSDIHHNWPDPRRDAAEIVADARGVAPDVLP
ncbi:secretion protein [Sphingobium sp. CAP-1]|uniref:secretion protein n=1 Tax=Sphingobium sp. CAP-1 TaxID=2676077 RepID=UPI0012BB2D8B|nr:secretion protein [Sphingobium sp. CAP-1]QGP80918.1 secretion protein [Sphingobium sp. CAP-1]